MPIVRLNAERLSVQTGPFNVRKSASQSGGWRELADEEVEVHGAANRLHPEQADEQVPAEDT
jgi:hypothetical protein